MAETESEIQKKIHPWKYHLLIYNNNGTEIWTLRNNPDWLMKIHYGDTDQEHRFLQLTAEHPCRNQVQIYTDPVDRFGKISADRYWYVMRKYEIPPLNHMKNDWRRLGKHILEFLEDLHRRYRQVHMDIKTTNILYDQEKNGFIVSDYGLTESPCPYRTTNTTFANHRYYYYRFGAVPDEPFLSYRMDLTMMAYMLLDLTWAYPDAPAFEEAFILRRENPNMLIPTEAEIFAMRDSAVAKASPVVQELLRTIAASVPWDTEIPPPTSFYAKLVDILSVDEGQKVLGLADQS